MGWQLALQSATTLIAGIGAWFLYDFVREFKAWKSEASKEIQMLKAERQGFLNQIRASEMSMTLRASELKEIVSNSRVQVKADIIDLKADLREIKNLTSNHESFMKKSLEVSKHFSKEIRTIKIKLGEVMILKNGK